MGIGSPNIEQGGKWDCSQRPFWKLGASDGIKTAGQKQCDFSVEVRRFKLTMADMNLIKLNSAAPPDESQG